MNEANTTGRLSVIMAYNTWWTMYYSLCIYLVDEMVKGSKFLECEGNVCRYEYFHAVLGQEVVQTFQLLPSHPSFFFCPKVCYNCFTLMIIIINVRLNNGDPF